MIFFCIALFLWACALKKHYFPEDEQGPAQRTSAWAPNRIYDVNIEAALGILSKIEPNKVRYLRSLGIPINFSNYSGKEGDTSLDEGIIRISDKHKGKAPETAVILAHEIFHLQRHDPDTRPGKTPLASRLIWLSEEQYAHWESLVAAAKLFPKYPSVWHALGFGWLFEWMSILASPIILIAFAALSLLVWSEMKAAKDQRKRRLQLQLEQGS